MDVEHFVIAQYTFHMRVRGLDQSVAWVMAVFFTCVLGGGLYAVSRYLATKNYTEIYGNEDEEMKRAKAQTSINTQTIKEKAAETTSEKESAAGDQGKTPEGNAEHTAPPAHDAPAHPAPAPEAPAHEKKH